MFLPARNKRPERMEADGGLPRKHVDTCKSAEHKVFDSYQRTSNGRHLEGVKSRTSQLPCPLTYGLEHVTHSNPCRNP